MIRYVLAALLAVALLAMAVPAIEYAATQNTDRHVATAITDIEDAAVSLMNDEEIPPEGHPSPQRIVTITVPDDSLTTHSLSRFEIERISENASMARYRHGGRAERNEYVDAPIVQGDPHDNRTVEIGGSGERTFALTLEADEDGDPVVVLERV